MRASYISPATPHVAPPAAIMPQDGAAPLFQPFAPQAFALAHSRQTPVFLLIGDETEAFLDPSLRAQLLERTVPVRLSPGERPDVELLCRRAAAILSGEGALPLCALLLHNGLPFLAAPLPPAGYAADASRLFIWLSHADRRFVQNRAAMHRQALDVLRSFDAPPVKKAYVPADAAHDLARAILAVQDTVNGGFGKLKSPMLPLLRFMQHAAARGDRAAHAALSRAIEAMCAGALLDPVDGLFFSATLTEDWRVFVPQKPLALNALLALVLLESGHRSEAVRVLDALLNSFSLPGGGFAPALYAPLSRYAFTPEQVCAQLGSEDGLRACRLLGLLRQHRKSDPLVTPSRFSPPPPQKPARPSLDEPARPLCPILSEPPIPEDEAFLRRVYPLLRHARAARARELPTGPMEVTSCALAATVFAAIGKRLGEARYTQAAQRSAAALLALLPGGDVPGALPPAFAAGGMQMRICGAAAGLTLLLLTLADGDADSAYASAGLRLLGSALHAFVREDGMVMHTPAIRGEVFPRVPAIFDGEEPSPAALMVWALKKAQALRPEAAYGEAIETIFIAAAPSLRHEPLACASLIDALTAK